MPLVLINDSCCRVFVSRTATMETRTGRRCVMYVTWRSPLPWWPSLTTRAKFMPRTWDWKLSAPRLHVCTDFNVMISFMTSSPLPSLFCFRACVFPDWRYCFLFNSSLPNTTSSGSAKEETRRWFKRHAGDRRRRRQQQPGPFLLHLPGLLQQSAHGPAALRGQEAQETDDQAETDGDIRPLHSSRSGHTSG